MNWINVCYSIFFMCLSVSFYLNWRMWYRKKMNSSDKWDIKVGFTSFRQFAFSLMLFMFFCYYLLHFKSPEVVLPSFSSIVFSIMGIVLLFLTWGNYFKKAMAKERIFQNYNNNAVIVNGITFILYYLFTFL